MYLVGSPVIVCLLLSGVSQHSKFCLMPADWGKQTVPQQGQHSHSKLSWLQRAICQVTVGLYLHKCEVVMPLLNQPL